MLGQINIKYNLKSGYRIKKMCIFTEKMSGYTLVKAYSNIDYKRILYVVKEVNAISSLITAHIGHK